MLVWALIWRFVWGLSICLQHDSYDWQVSVGWWEEALSPLHVSPLAAWVSSPLGGCPLSDQIVCACVCVWKRERFKLWFSRLTLKSHGIISTMFCLLDAKPITKSGHMMTYRIKSTSGKEVFGTPCEYPLAPCHFHFSRRELTSPLTSHQITRGCLFYSNSSMIELSVLKLGNGESGNISTDSNDWHQVE